MFLVSRWRGYQWRWRLCTCAGRRQRRHGQDRVHRCLHCHCLHVCHRLGGARGITSGLLPWPSYGPFYRPYFWLDAAAPPSTGSLAIASSPAPPRSAFPSRTNKNKNNKNNKNKKNINNNYVQQQPTYNNNYVQQQQPMYNTRQIKSMQSNFIFDCTKCVFFLPLADRFLLTTFPRLFLINNNINNNIRSAG